MREKKFYRCAKCGNIISYYNDSGVSVMCCGEKMSEIAANSTDAAGEKHVPVVKVDGSKVSVAVGSVMHPMSEEHLISWIYLLTDKGGYERFLTPSDEPTAVFTLADGEKAVRVYEYCNLHGLWSVDL